MSNFTTWRSLVDGEEVGGIPDSAVLHYPFKDRDNNTIVEVLQDENATANGTTNISNNWFEGFAEDFDGDDDRVEIPIQSWTSTVQNVNWGFAFTFTSNDNGSFENLFGGPGGGTGHDITVRSGVRGSSGSLETEMHSGGDRIEVYSDASGFFDGGKYRVFWRSTGNDASDLELYVNNSEESLSIENNNSGFDWADFDPPDEPLFMGGDNNGGDLRRFTDMEGDNVIVYNNPTRGDIEEDYNIQPWS